MSFTQKDLIVAYRNKGLTYQELAKKYGVSEQYCRTVCSRVNKKHSPSFISPDLCRYCGNPLVFTNGAKRKQFCSDQCRSAYHNRNNIHKAYICYCELCGKEFVSFGYPKKRFCSRECQTKAQRRTRENSK